MVVDTKYTFGDVVHMVADKDQLPRVLTGFLIQPIGTRIELSSPADTDYRYECELSNEKMYSLNIKTNSNKGMKNRITRGFIGAGLWALFKSN